MVQIIQDFIPVGRGNRPGLMARPFEAITIHDTDNRNWGAGAKMHAAYLKGDAAGNPNDPKSWHLTVDDVVAYQHLPIFPINLCEHGWHCTDGPEGPGNLTSIGIEIAMNADGNRAQAEQNAAWLVAWLWQQRGGRCPLWQHHHWSGKNCPSVLRGRVGGWDQFWGLVVAQEHAMSIPQASQDDAWAKLAVLEAANKELHIRLAAVQAERDKYKGGIRATQGIVNQFPM